MPIGTTRLQAVLAWLRIDAAGESKPAEALVFSNEAGEPMGSFRTTWVTTVLKAHDIQPKWSTDGYRELQAELPDQQFRELNLHWHDLRQRVRVAPGRARRSAVASARSARPRVDHDH